MYSTADDAVSTDLACACGRWTHRLLHLVSAPGISAAPGHCRKCQSTYLFVFHTDEDGVRRVLANIRLTGKNERSLQNALSNIGGVSPRDVRFMLAGAQLAGG